MHDLLMHATMNETAKLHLDDKLLDILELAGINQENITKKCQYIHAAEEDPMPATALLAQLPNLIGKNLRSARSNYLLLFAVRLSKKLTTIISKQEQWLGYYGQVAISKFIKISSCDADKRINKIFSSCMVNTMPRYHQYT